MFKEDSERYDFAAIEPRWQKKWEDGKTFATEGVACGKEKYYILDMFPYPSSSGLHVGHIEGYTASDVLARYKKALGYNVLHPMGWDAFGLPAEQHAVATGTHPAVNTEENINNFREQIKRVGLAIDWDREINTTDPDYYRWTQWIFLKLFQHGLAYVDERSVWWCPALGTVLANEEVIDGRSERGNHPVERKLLRQWILRITAYADKLLEALPNLDWPESTKRQQTAWIGRSEGAEIVFKVGNSAESLKVFTTRPDTLCGVTYVVIAPEHPLVSTLTTDPQQKAVCEYVKKVANKSDLDRTDLSKEKSGVFTGAYAINPVNGDAVPIWAADYVLMSYGTGAVMAVPAHDERDFAFAQQFALPIKEVIQKAEHTHHKEHSGNHLPFTGEGILVNSGKYDGLLSTEAKNKILWDLETAQSGRKVVCFKLRDWLFSRQRYWGEPFPIIWVNEEGYQKVLQSKTSPFREFLPQSAITYRADGQAFYAVPLASTHLPLKLPEIQSYQPSGTADSPLANAKGWVNVALNVITGEIIPKEELKVKTNDWILGTRETNTMPQWAGSCWYYLRYLSPKEGKAFVNKDAERYWGTPDFYIGGAEHAVLHLLYARFWHQFLYDIGEVSTPEPFKKLFHQGIIVDAEGNKMSKSRGNVVNPDDIVKTHGADALRLYELFLGPLEAMKPWNTQSIEGVSRFLKKVWRLFVTDSAETTFKMRRGIVNSAETDTILHETILKVTEAIDHLRFNTGIAQLMICLNHLQSCDGFSWETGESFLQLLAPLAPHIAEELWHRLGHRESICLKSWPKADLAKIASDEMTIVLQINGKMRGNFSVAKTTSQECVLERAKSQEKACQALSNGRLIKAIYVPGKLVNLVIQ